MKRNKPIEINFYQLINFFWEKKILILTCSIVITTFVFYLCKKQTEIYQSYAIIQKPFISLFDNYDDSYKKKNENNLSLELHNNFYQIFLNNLRSETNFLSFLENHDEQGKKFVKSLKKSNTSPKKYLKYNFGTEDSLNPNVGQNDLFYFNYPKDINGDKIVIQYISHIKKITSEEFLNIQKIKIEEKIKKLENYLDIFNNLNNSNIKSELSINNKIKIKTENTIENLKIIETELKQLNLEKEEILKKNYFVTNYNPIIDKSESLEKKIYPKTLKITLITFLLANLILFLILLFNKIKQEIY